MHEAGAIEPFGRRATPNIGRANEFLAVIEQGTAGIALATGGSRFMLLEQRGGFLARLVFLVVRFVRFLRDHFLGCRLALVAAFLRFLLLDKRALFLARLVFPPVMRGFRFFLALRFYRGNRCRLFLRCFYSFFIRNGVGFLIFFLRRSLFSRHFAAALGFDHRRRFGCGRSIKTLAGKQQRQ